MRNWSVLFWMAGLLGFIVLFSSLPPGFEFYRFALIVVAFVILTGLLFRGYHKRSASKFSLKLYAMPAGICVFAIPATWTYFKVAQYQNDEGDVFWFIVMPLLAGILVGGIFIAIGLQYLLGNAKSNRGDGGYS